VAEVVGLIPAAGSATRLGALPCSKEVLPVGLRATADGPRVRVACESLLDGFRRGGVDRAFVLLRRGKWDVPDHLGTGERFGLHLAYLALEPTGSVPETLDAAFPFVDGATVALGFPDIHFEPADAYARLLRHLEEAGDGGPEAVLGLVPSTEHRKTDMVELDDRGRVRRIAIKQPDAGLRHAWTVAVWTPRFTRFLHDFLRADSPAPRPRELYPGDVFQAAVDGGMRVDGVVFEDGRQLDVGTPDGLATALARFRGQEPDQGV
jgi:glucose-1-phosphate thymidylyltransferase